MPVGPTPDPAGEPEIVIQAWEARIRVLTNPSAWFGMCASIGGGALCLGLLFSFISKSLMGFLVALAIFCGLMLLFVMIGAVIDVFGGFRVTFFLTGQGVRSLSGAGAKAAANAAIVGGILSGSLTGMGPGRWPGPNRMSSFPGERSRA
jgi:hypothetical protein